MSSDSSTIFKITSGSFAGAKTDPSTGAEAGAAVKTHAKVVEKVNKPCIHGPKCHNFHCGFNHTKEQEEVRKYKLKANKARFQIKKSIEQIEVWEKEIEDQDSKFLKALTHYETENLKKVRRDQSQSRASGRSGRSRSRAPSPSSDEDDEDDEETAELKRKLEELRFQKKEKQRGRSATRFSVEN